MTTPRLNHQIVWSPHKDSNLFLLGSSNDLRLYEYIPKGPTKLIFVSPMEAAIAAMKCFAWSPDPNLQSLIAAGFANGKTYLVNLHDESTISESHTSSSSSFNVLPLKQQPYVVLNSSRNTKSCSNIAFSSAEPKLLATGFEKVRNEYCLLIWDVERAANSSSSLNGDKNYGGGTLAEAPSRTGSIGSSVKSDHNSPGGFCRVNDSDNYNFPLAGFGSIYDPSLVPRPLPAPSNQYNSRPDETKPIHNFGLSENVNSINWFPTNSKQIVAGMSGKSLKIFDLRLAENPTITISTRAVYGVKTDPYNNHRFASFEEVGYMGNICLWDDRKNTEALPSIHVLSISTEARPIRISFSASRSGLLASLSNDASYISLYDIQETTCKLRRFSTTLSTRDSPSDEIYPLDSLNNGFGGNGGMPTTKSVTMGNGVSVPSAGIVMATADNPTINEKCGVCTNGSTFNFGSKTDEGLDMPILWKSRKTQRLSKSLVSFSWIPTISTSHSHRLLVINKEQTFETITLEESPNFGWEPRGNMSIFGPTSFKTYDVDQKIHDYGNLGSGGDIHDNIGGDDQHHGILYNNNNESNLHHHSGTGYGHKPRVSLDLKDDYYSGNRTPRPGDLNDSPKGQLKSIMTHRSHNESIEKNDEKELLMSPFKALKELQEDISVVMRRRAKLGYSMVCRANEEILRDTPKLKALWNWIALAEQPTSEGRNSDVSFQGIYSVWTASTISKRASPMSTPKASPPRSSSEKLDQFVDANELSITISTSKLPQRKLALTICGWGFGKKELEETLQRMERAGNCEKAAGLALFHGEIEQAIAVLNNSRDERLKLVSTALAGYAANNHDTFHQASSLWREMCKNLSYEMQDPYLRAMFSYIATGHWFDVLQEGGLSLQDRIGIALRFLDDEELDDFLHETTAKVIADGDIDGVILTGLTLEGVSLFENYINNTCDVQTASLALSFCVPRKFKDSRVTNWIENYRMLLDKWQMFHIRARFDIARGKYMVSSTSSAADMVPPQVYVRCNFCSQSISHSLWIPGMKSKDGNRVAVPVSYPGVPYKQKTTCCPGCRKPLPRCSICLLSLGTPTDEAMTANLQNGSSNDKPFGFDLWFTWCQSCRHGGHAIHMLQWFQKHGVCPVSECTCECEI